MDEYNKQNTVVLGSTFGAAAVLILILIILVYIYYGPNTAHSSNPVATTQSSFSSGTKLVELMKGVSSAGKGTLESVIPGSIYKFGVPLFLIVLAAFCFGFSTWYTLKYGSFTSTAESVNSLLTIRRQSLGVITSGPENKHSVCLSLTNKTRPYSQIEGNETALVNWRPLTVRLAGYLGGVNGPSNGVFDMDFGISNAIYLGARSFIFDIDYLDAYPCAPVLLYQDANKIHRSLNTGSIANGMTALSRYAFGGDTSNYDPVVIVLYIRRVPQGNKQKSTFYKAIAKAMSPISADHLGSTEQGNFHNYMSEQHLFTTKITSFQKKFIVLSNHVSSDIGEISNPKENLNFWTNARLYTEAMGKSSSLSDISPSSDSTSIPYATIGDASQLLLLSVSQQTAYARARNVYKIALCPLENLDSVVTVPNLSFFLNLLGINSVPLDILTIGAAKCHSSSFVNPIPAGVTLENLANGTSARNTTDPLSFWSYAGWSKKFVDRAYRESFMNYVKAEPIPGFIIPEPVVPKKPHPSTNSNGGLVSIA